MWDSARLFKCYCAIAVVFGFAAAQRVTTHSFESNTFQNPNAVPTSETFDILEHLHLNEYDEYYFNGEVREVPGSTVQYTAYRIEEESNLTVKATEAFPGGFPMDFSLESVFRTQNSLKHPWNLLEITDYSFEEQMSITINPGYHTIDFSMPTVQGDLQTVSFRESTLFDNRWHKLMLSVDRDTVRLWVDCRPISDIYGLRRAQLEPRGPIHNFEGYFSIAKVTKADRTIPVDIQLLILHCDADKPTKTNCEEIPKYDVLSNEPPTKPFGEPPIFGANLTEKQTVCPEQCPTGPPGYPGAPGISGQKGEAGARGLPGYGAPGPMGQKGESGIPGFPGIKGEVGFPGANGVPGPPGLPGQVIYAGREEHENQVIMGQKGDSGIPGSPGNPGQPGLPGRPGPPGPPGFPGLSTGSDYPQPSDSHNSDDHIRDICMVVVREYIAEIMPSLVGQPGPPGKSRAGPKGSPGRPGPPGEAGLVGPMGSRGFVGLPGPQGAIGPQGDRGEPGFSGPRGETGERGFPGLPGAPGLHGPPGNDGFPGRSGDKGDTGAEGREGPQGPPGHPGVCPDCSYNNAAQAQYAYAMSLAQAQRNSKGPQNYNEKG